MQSQIEELRRRNAELGTQVAALCTENHLLQQKVQFLLKRLFGSTSEKIDPRQLELLLGYVPATTLDDDDDPPKPPTPPRPRAPHDRKPRLPENLPTEEIVIDPEAVKQNPTAYQCIGEEVTEELKDRVATMVATRVDSKVEIREVFKGETREDSRVGIKEDSREEIREDSREGIKEGLEEKVIVGRADLMAVEDSTTDSITAVASVASAETDLEEEVEVTITTNIAHITVDLGVGLEVDSEAVDSKDENIIDKSRFEMSL